MRYLLILTLVFLFQVFSNAMAAHYTQLAYNWRGKSAASMIKELGSPDMQYPGPHGQTVYVYKTETYKTYNNPPPAASWVHVAPNGRAVVGTTYNPTNTNQNLNLICTTTYIANAQGIITQVQSQGVCQSQ